MGYKLISFIFTVLTGCILAGCGNRKVNNMLAHADSLISKEQDDSAMAVLEKMGEIGRAHV